MATKTVDLNQEPMSLKELLSLVRENTEIVLTQGNTPLARLIAITSNETLRQPGLHSGAISISDDFDEPLPDEFWIGST
jgi:antitoxin (DNA-binding transcriptional repressor) of toxin-antitoxin stability system